MKQPSFTIKKDHLILMTSTASILIKGKTMKAISTNGLTALEEVERRLLIFAESIDPKYSKDLNELQSFVGTTKDQLHNFKERSLATSEEKLDEEFIVLCREYNLDSEHVDMRDLFVKSHLEKEAYIQELEGLLSGDPNLTADEYSIKHWRHCANLYADKLEKKIKDLEAELNKKQG